MTLRPASTIDTDVLVVGGGVTGCATAYYLAREGIETVLVDRGDVNAEGSGANAGSLHTMLVSRFFRSEDPLWVRGREILIPMLREAVEVWRELRTELDTDIELKLDGGLMVAETEDELRLLERKAAVERRCGLDAHVVTGADLSKLAPYVSDRVVGAEFCRQEGKVNPLPGPGCCCKPRSNRSMRRTRGSRFEPTAGRCAAGASSTPPALRRRGWPPWSASSFRSGPTPAT